MSVGVVGCGARCTAMSLVVAAVAGGLLGAGLLISGMTDPAKVIGFLAPLRGWDPSLGFVMGGAAGVYALLFRLVKRWRAAPLIDRAFHLPTRRDIDASLVAGAAIFGIGWGLGGLCPGPGVVAAAAGSSAGILFTVAMLVGMLAQHGWVRR